ncbi:neuropeptide CCHamide-2 [Phlebotomus argentipes]|uniref:neuropeptide CCHamide-2 n=1 Tax=Phlebotomus argentipes TaxID=94469 RepID=UPI002892AAB8|nr:neuropeptide CCHamide-2 [Phlebotomus argentipes]
MQQFSLYFAFILVILIGNSEAKRGCSLYGHSCYGGHGKRSTLPRLADGLSLDAAPSPLLKLLRDTSRPYPPSLVADYPDLYENDNEPDNLRVVKDFNRAIFTLLRQLAENRMRNPADVENHQNPDANEFYKTTTANNNNQIHNI